MYGQAHEEPQRPTQGQKRPSTNRNMDTRRDAEHKADKRLKEQVERDTPQRQQQPSSVLPLPPKQDRQRLAMLDLVLDSVLMLLSCPPLTSAPKTWPCIVVLKIRSPSHAKIYREWKKEFDARHTPDSWRPSPGQSSTEPSKSFALLGAQAHEQETRRTNTWSPVQHSRGARPGLKVSRSKTRHERDCLSCKTRSSRPFNSHYLVGCGIHPRGQRVKTSRTRETMRFRV